MLIVNIASIQGIIPGEYDRLAGKDMEARCGELADAYLLVENGLISRFGPMSELTEADYASGEVFDAAGGMLLPSFCDSQPLNDSTVQSSCKKH